MMTLVRWHPTRDVVTRRQEMNRLANEFFRGGIKGRVGWWAGSRTPAVDMYENDQTLTLKVELPGFSKEDVQVEIKDNMLTLKGERKRETEVKKEQYHRVERAYGAFQRSFMLPVLVDADKAEATFKDGVLELKLPKAEEAKPKAIRVTA
ncbi:MAG: Hsp20/alpha crystallin family protein [Candidatus Entotheonellia bacterium]